jgi:hypothetical protein
VNYSSTLAENPAETSLLETCLVPASTEPEPACLSPPSLPADYAKSLGGGRAFELSPCQFVQFLRGRTLWLIGCVRSGSSSSSNSKSALLQLCIVLLVQQLQQHHSSTRDVIAYCKAA